MTGGNSWSWQHNLQVFCAMYSLFLIRMLGLWPYTIDPRTNKFKTTWCLMLQPIFTGTIFCISLFLVLPIILPSFKRQWKSDAANMLMEIFGILNIVSLFTTYISVYLQTKNIKSIIVRTQEIVVKCQRLLTNDTIRSASAVFLYFFKSFILLACFTLLPCLKVWIASLKISGYILPFVVIPILINATVPILFFGAILFATVYFERINVKIEEIARMANLLTLQKRNGFGRMRRYCELSDLLDELAVLHMELTRLTQDVCKICNANMTNYIIWLSVNTIVQKLFVYMNISTGLMDLIAFPKTNVVVGILSITVVWIDLIMFAHLCFTIMREVYS